MVSVNDPKARDIANEFARWATDQYHEFQEFMTLYGCSEKRLELLEETAKGFFSDLFVMYIDRIILNVSKLTGHPQMGQNQNFSIRYVHDYFKSCPGYRVEDAAKFVDCINAKANGGEPGVKS